MTSLVLAVPVIRPGIIDQCLDCAKKSAANAAEVSLLLFGNGLPDLRSVVAEESLSGWKDVRIETSQLNEGAPYALQRMWEAASERPGAASDDVILYIHDDAFLKGAGWDTTTSTFFETHPECVLAGYSGAPGLGVDGLYSRSYDMMDLVRVGFVSNLPNAEAHGVRGHEPRRIVLTDGYSMALRRSFLDTLGGWKWWPYADHNYEVGIGCEVARARKEAWYLPVETDHLSGWSALSAQGQEMYNRHGGQIALQERSARYLYDHYRDVLPLRVR